MADRREHFRNELRQLIDDDRIDFTNAVLIMPSHRNMIRESPYILTTIGVLEWCKRALFIASDREKVDFKPMPEVPDKDEFN